MKKAMIEQLVLGMVGTNTWLIKNKESNELLIIDPADESARIEEKIDRMGGIPVAVLLTHGHFDHMLAADDLRDEYGIPIIACAAEQQVLTDSIKNLSGSWASAHVLLADQWICDGKKLELAGFSIEVFHTPGHTAGSCCYYLPEEEILFSGDTLFAQCGKNRFSHRKRHRYAGECKAAVKRTSGDDKSLSGTQRRNNNRI